jgi:hypothetical protein
LTLDRWISAAVAVVIAAATTRAQPLPRLVATVAGNAVYASFDLQPETSADLDERLSKPAPTVVIWLVQLNRAALLRDRRIVRSVIRVSAQAINGTDMFSVTRSVNGVTTDDGVRLDRQSAVTWLTSFPPVPLFEHFQLDDHAAHRLTISAILEGHRES